MPLHYPSLSLPWLEGFLSRLLVVVLMIRSTGARETLALVLMIRCRIVKINEDGYFHTSTKAPEERNTVNG